MKGRPLQELRDVIKRRCMVCGKEKEAFYGNWQEGGTCSRKCELVFTSKPRYGGNHEVRDMQSTDR